MARDSAALAAHCLRIDGRGYKAYRDLQGTYAFKEGSLELVHAQGDPFAEPSRLRWRAHRVPAWTFADPTDRIGAADFLHRRLHRALTQASTSVGTGGGGRLRVPRPGQAILRRASVWVGPEGQVELRFRAGLPARGRRVMGRAASSLLVDVVPSCIAEALTLSTRDRGLLDDHLATLRRQRGMREALEASGLVAFVGEGANLPRASGAEDTPMRGGLPIAVGESLVTRLQVGETEIRGMGIREGLSLIVGGGFHGKSTLLSAVAQGIYDHVPGDGRELVVTRKDAMTVRAEDGRSVVGVDISNFMNNLPSGADTRSFSTQNASGSTSQAAAIIEALESGSRLLLIDEDTSATNFMIRDEGMRALVPSAREPITPLMDRIRSLKEAGVSMVLVVGGSSAFLSEADHVISMEEYHPVDRSEEARRIAPQRRSGGSAWVRPRPRRIDPASLRFTHPRDKVKVTHVDRVSMAREEVDLMALNQLREKDQTRWLASLLSRGEGPELDAAARWEEVVGNEACAWLGGHWEAAEARFLDARAFMNRVRWLRVSQAQGEP